MHTNILSLETLFANKQQQWTTHLEILEAAQPKMKSYADANRTERERVCGWGWGLLEAPALQTGYSGQM